MVNVIREIWLPVDNFDGYYISNLGYERKELTG